MATKYWVGTDEGHEGDWETAANWSPSGVPTAGDTVIFNAGSENADTNIDQSDVALVKLIVTAGYSGLLGATGTHLILDVDTIQFAGQGTANYIELKGADTGVDINCDITVTDSGTGANALHIATTDVADGGGGGCDSRIQHLRILRGVVLVDASAKFSATADEGNIIVGYVTNATSDVTLTIGASVTGIQRITQTGGTVACGSAVTEGTGTLELYAGSHTHSAGNIDVANVYGGTFYLTATSGTITALNCFGGTFNGSGATTCVLTTINLYRGATLNLNNDQRDWTLTNGVVIRTSSPSLRLDEGTVAALTLS